MKNSDLVNRTIKIDFEGNLYVEVNDSENPCIYTIVYISIVPEPEANICESILGKW